MSVLPIDLILHDLADQARKSPQPEHAEMAALVQSCVNQLALVEQMADHDHIGVGHLIYERICGAEAQPSMRTIEILVAQRLAMHAFALLLEDLGAARKQARDLLDLARRITGLDEPLWITVETRVGGFDGLVLRQRGPAEYQAVYNGAVVSTGSERDSVSRSGVRAITRRTAPDNAQSHNAAQRNFRVGDRVQCMRRSKPDSRPAFGDRGGVVAVDEDVNNGPPVKVQWDTSSVATWHYDFDLMLITPDPA